MAEVNELENYKSQLKAVQSKLDGLAEERDKLTKYGLQIQGIVSYLENKEAAKAKEKSKEKEATKSPEKEEVPTSTK